MRLDFLQDEICAWGKATFPDATIDSVLAHLEDEVVELGLELQPDRVTDDGELPEIDKAKAGAEAADVAILLMQLCGMAGIDLHLEINKKHEINKARKWGKPDERGVVRHIAEPPAHQKDIYGGVDLTAPVYKPSNDIGPVNGSDAVLVRDWSPPVKHHA